MERRVLLWAFLLFASLTQAQPPLDFGPDSSFCEGSFVLLDATFLNADSYLWQDGSTNSTFIVAQTGTYWLQATTASQVQSDTIILTANPLPHVDLGEDISICPWDSASPVLLTGPLGMASYFWNISGPAGLFYDQHGCTG